jgi:hypothetical protein
LPRVDAGTTNLAPGDNQEAFSSARFELASTPTPTTAEGVNTEPQEEGCQLLTYGLPSFGLVPASDLLAAADAADDIDSALAAELQAAEAESGFAIPDRIFRGYFMLKGWIRVLGCAASRPFTLLGYDVQLFQRRMSVRLPDAGVGQASLSARDLIPQGSRNLPDDLAESAADSPLFGQYSLSSPAGLARPWELPGTDLTLAFDP